MSSYDPSKVGLPALLPGLNWFMKVNTKAEGAEYREEPVEIGNNQVLAGERSVIILTAEKSQTWRL